MQEEKRGNIFLIFLIFDRVIFFECENNICEILHCKSFGISILFAEINELNLHKIECDVPINNDLGFYIFS